MARRKVTLNIALTPAQKQIESSDSRFKIIKAGRRFGKTEYAAYWIVKNALTKPGLHWYVAKTMGLVRDEFWPRVLNLIPSGMIKRRDDRFYQLEIDCGAFTSIIACKSAEKEDNLRGRGVASLIIDEASFVRQTLWNYVLQATVADKKAPVLFISSPRRGWFTRQWELANAGKLPGWAAFKFTIHDNPHIAPDEIERLRRSTPENIWLQEYMAEEQDHSGVVYTEFSENSIFNPDQKFLEANTWPCVVGIDYGLADDTAAVWVHAHPKGFLVVTRRHIQNGWDVARHASVIHQNSRGLSLPYGSYVLDRSSFRKEATSRTSIADQFRENGITCQKSEKDVNVGIDFLKKFMRGDGAMPWIYFSTRCAEIIRDIQEWEYDSHEPDSLAALRYAIVHAIRRKMTVLADAAPSSEFEEPAPTIAPGRIMLPGFGKKRKSQWSWDYDAGALA